MTDGSISLPTILFQWVVGSTLGLMTMVIPMTSVLLSTDYTNSEKFVKINKDTSHNFTNDSNNERPWTTEHVGQGTRHVYD